MPFSPGRRCSHCPNEVLAFGPVKAHLLLCPMAHACPWTRAEEVQEWKSFPTEISRLFAY